MSKNGATANSVAQFTNNDDVMPADPATDIWEIFCIASIIFFSCNTIPVKYKSVVLNMDGCMKKKGLVTIYSECGFVKNTIKLV